MASLKQVVIGTALALVCIGCGLGLAGCAGGPSETQASTAQFALAATVAAAPTSTARSTAPSTPSSTPTVAPTVAPPSATPQPATAAPTSVPDTQTAQLPTATAPAPTATSEPATPSPTAPPATSTPLPTVPPTVPPPTSTAIPSPEPAPAEAPQPTSLPQPEPPAAQVTAPSGEAHPIKFNELYSGASITGPILSDLAKSLHGQKVVMNGFMAPPLKPDIDFFVLTQTPMVFCPFCNTAADWPFDIVFVRMAAGRSMPAVVPSQGIRVTGTFSVGTDTDQATGFVSLVRIFADTVEIR